MKKLLLIFIFLIINSAPLYAQRWYCEQVASEKEGRIFNACGIGLGKTEAEAREKSFKNAQKEFSFFCENSFSCKNRKKNVTPGRISCKFRKKTQDWICKRLIVIEVKEELDNKKSLKERTSDSEIKKKEAKLNDLRKELIKIKKIERIKKEIEHKKRAINSIKKGKKVREEEIKVDDTSSSEIERKEKELDTISKALNKLRTLEEIKRKIEKKKEIIKLIKEGKYKKEEREEKPAKGIANDIIKNENEEKDNYFSLFTYSKRGIKFYIPVLGAGSEPLYDRTTINMGLLGAYWLFLKNDLYNQSFGIGGQYNFHMAVPNSDTDEQNLSIIITEPFLYLNLRYKNIDFSIDFGTFNFDEKKSFSGFGIRYIFSRNIGFTFYLSYRTRFFEGKNMGYITLGLIENPFF